MFLSIKKKLTCLYFVIHLILHFPVWKIVFVFFALDSLRRKLTKKYIQKKINGKFCGLKKLNFNILCFVTLVKIVKLNLKNNNFYFYIY